MESYVGQVGVVVEIATGQDLSEATLTRYNVVKPDNTTTTWAAVESETAGSLTYTTGSTDLATAGRYLVSAYVEWGETSKHLGDSCILYARPSGYNAATYTYDPTNRPVDAVRLLIGQSESLEHLTDGEIEYCITQTASTRLAASMACKIIASTFAGLVDYTIGDLSEKLSQKAASYRKRAEELRTEETRSSFGATTPTVSFVTDSANMPDSYRMADGSETEWSLDRDDAPNDYRGLDK